MCPATGLKKTRLSKETGPFRKSGKGEGGQNKAMPNIQVEKREAEEMQLSNSAEEEHRGERGESVVPKDA